MNLLNKIANAFDRIIGILASLGACLIAFTIFSVTFEVVMRYFLNRPSIWVVELNAYSLLFITFLGTTWLLNKEGHVKVDLLLNHLKPGIQALLNVVSSILGAFVSLVIALGSTVATWEAFQIGYKAATELAAPKWILLSIIPICSFLLFLQFLRRTYRNIASMRMSQINGEK